MTQPFRLAAGGAVDRARTLRFTFDGRVLTGHPGDTLASALLANGVHLVGRSFKFHRPRGVLSAGPEEPNALVTVGEGARATPSVRATVQPLYEGLVATSQNRWPSLGFDVGRLNDFLHPLFPAGFYNKTFKWPNWETYEHAIRRAAGLGRVPPAPDPDRYAWRNAYADVLVIGGGAAGLVAAITAAEAGARVLLVEARPRLVETLARGPAVTRADLGVAGWLGSLEARLRACPTARVLSGSTVVGAYDHGTWAAVEDLESRGHALEPGSEPPACRQRWWRIRAGSALLATGAIEQPLVFPDNDRPGILLAGAVHTYLRQHAVRVGDRIALATNNDAAYEVALALLHAGATLAAVLDTRPAASVEGWAAAAARELGAAGVPLLHDAQIRRTAGTRRIAWLDYVAGDRASGRVRCDALAVSGGWQPTVHLYSHAGGRLRYDEELRCLVPAENSGATRAIGAAAGRFDPRSACADAAAAARSALEHRGRGTCATDATLWADAPSTDPGAIGALGYRGSSRRARAWVDLQHDATVADLDLAVRENYVSVEHAKRYTTVGMSVDQGKTSNLNALAILAQLTGQPVGAVGNTTFRPPYVPVTLGTIAGGRRGRFYRPVRRLPTHDWQVANGALLEDYGGWRRPVCYPRSGENEDAAIAREVRTVRAQAGLFEASPLGKFLVRGPDAAEFLHRIYANTIRNLEIGRVRYGLMLNERGIVIDDGVCARLGAEEFWVNTTSGGAPRIGAWMEEWRQTEWPDLDVAITDVTSGYATFGVAGPRAREVLIALGCSIDLRREAFPHLHARDGEVAGLPARVLRVSYTGELSYELSVAADAGVWLWCELLRVGAPLGLVPYGIESLMWLRTEKGYLHVGSETDGTTVPADVGFGTPVARKQGDFVGRRSLAVPENVRADRFELVGLRCAGDPAAFVAGAHLVGAGVRAPPGATEGYLTSACPSPTLGGHVGLAMLARGATRLGEAVRVVHGAHRGTATVVAPTHYDPAGERLDG